MDVALSLTRNGDTVTVTDADGFWRFLVFRWFRYQLDWVCKRRLTRLFANELLARGDGVLWIFGVWVETVVSLLPWHVPSMNRCLLSASFANRYLIVKIIVYVWYGYKYGRELSVAGCVYFNVRQTYVTGTCCQYKKTKWFLRLLVRKILDCSSILRNINSFVEFLRYSWKAYILKIFRSKRYRHKLSTRFLIYFNIRRRNEWPFFILKNSWNACRMAKNACGWFGPARRPINSLLISRSLASIAWLTPVCPFQWLSPAPYNVFPSSSTAILPVYTSQDRNRS